MRIISFNGSIGRFDDESPFIVEDGTLSLKFELPQTLGNYYLLIHNSFDGGQNERTIPVPKTGEVTLDGLLAGELCMTLKHYVRGEAVSQIKIEPLRIQTVEGEARAIPEISDLENRTLGAEKFIEGHKKLHEEFDENLKGIFEKAKTYESAFHRLLIAFATFAWTTYCSSFVLNSKGLPLDEFLRVIGVDSDSLSEEDLAKITNKKEVL